MQRKNYFKGLITIFLGIWLWSMPFTFGFNRDVVDANDSICGMLFLLLGILWMLSAKEIFSWLICFVGLWLQVAPLLFWYPAAAGYLNDTVVGIVAVIVSVIIPDHFSTEHGDYVPKGWSYNPSAWSQRVPIIALATICWLTSRYLAAYQLGYISTVWDPFFGDGTWRVITSSVSKAWPVSDAGLGAFAYTLEALMGCEGDAKRWCSSPWSVIIMGFLVIPVGIVSTGLIILQPVAVGAWCSLCLFTASCMLLMIALTMDEVAACVQFLAQTHREGKPFWKTFWCGGDPKALHARAAPPSSALSSLFSGVSCPWNLVFSALIGIWLMFSPSQLGSMAAAANNNFIIGALAVVFSVISFAEVGRSLRFVNVALGIWLVLSPWFLIGETPISEWNSRLVGVILLLLTLRKGAISRQYGMWSHFIH